MAAIKQICTVYRADQTPTKLCAPLTENQVEASTYHSVVRHIQRKTSNGSSFFFVSTVVQAEQAQELYDDGRSKQYGPLIFKDCIEVPPALPKKLKEHPV